MRQVIKEDNMDAFRFGKAAYRKTVYSDSRRFVHFIDKPPVYR